MATAAEVEQYDLPDDFLGFTGKVLPRRLLRGTKFEMSPAHSGLDRGFKLVSWS